MPFYIVIKWWLFLGISCFFALAKLLVIGMYEPILWLKMGCHLVYIINFMCFFFLLLQGKPLGTPKKWFDTAS